MSFSQLTKLSYISNMSNESQQTRTSTVVHQGHEPTIQAGKPRELSPFDPFLAQRGAYDMSHAKARIPKSSRAPRKRQGNRAGELRLMGRYFLLDALKLDFTFGMRTTSQALETPSRAAAQRPLSTGWDQKKASRTFRHVGHAAFLDRSFAKAS